MTKEASGFFAAHGSYFGGYFKIDGKEHRFSGKFHQSVGDLAIHAVNLEYNDVKDLKGLYTIGPKARLYPILLPLEKGPVNLRIIVYVDVAESSHEAVTGQLAWLPSE